MTRRPPSPRSPTEDHLQLPMRWRCHFRSTRDSSVGCSTFVDWSPNPLHPHGIPPKAFREDRLELRDDVVRQHLGRGRQQEDAGCTEKSPSARSSVTSWTIRLRLRSELSTFVRTRTEYLLSNERRTMTESQPRPGGSTTGPGALSATRPCSPRDQAATEA